MCAQIRSWAAPGGGRVRGVVRAGLLGAIGCLALWSPGVSAAQPAGRGGYREPPEAIRAVLDTPPTPGVSISPDGSRMLLLHYRGLPPVSDLSAPMLRLGGSRLNPLTSGPHGPRRISGFTLRDVAGKAAPMPVDLGGEANLSGPSWSVDGRFAMFTNTLDQGVELWVLDVASGKAKRLTDATVHGASGATARWMPDQKHLLVKFVPQGRGAMPERPRRPDGPVVQDATGETAPVRTYQDLLSDTYDEALFDWIMPSQLAVVNVETGARRNIGTPGIYAEASASPSGEYLLVGRVERPYSFLVPWSLFPQVWEVWSASDGRVVKEVARMPLRDTIPTQGVQTGPRGLEWVEVRPATLLWAEALDGGDPRKKVEHRDRVMTWAAPFAGEPSEFLRVQHRFSGVTWMEEAPGAPTSRAMLSEYERERRWTRTYLIEADRAMSRTGETRVVFDRSINDRYNDPGSPITDRTAQGFTVIKVHDDGVFLAGAGATPEGERPFLDRLSLADLSTTRLWRCEGEQYESVIDVVEGRAEPGLLVLTSHETKTSPPNVRVRTLSGGGLSEARAVTDFKDPTPQIRSIKKEIVTYARADGVPLSATVFTPPGYTGGERLPLIIWAYPNEVSDASTAGQVEGSEHRFTRIAGSSHLFLLLAGYAVMDDASMPVVGDPETVNNTFVTQIVANAQAAIDKAAAMGVADPRRVGVAGHSYGAFMTANLLAHAPAGMFRAGVARSGAYNRTLTPFGFQSERRSFWEARDVYVNMSPFTFADKIKTPVLLIHGQIDNNSGTFPIQSERLFQAIKGQGGTARLVVLPYESHGYAARESVGHVLAEMVEWFDRYVKPIGAPEAGAP
ncbi:MAG: prolyl oligopeptidase family serine peptidase [Planctomycetota bacterium]|nr:prolyl oligopeptidase family serine peptidase [Planctomycetota bacterium]